MRGLVSTLTFGFLLACAGGGGQSDEPVSDGKKSSLVTSSLFNNRLTSYSYDERKAKRVADKLRGEAGTSEAKLEESIAADRLAGGNFKNVVASYNGLAAATLKRDLNANVTDRAKLEMAYAAMREKQFAVVLLLIGELKQSPTNWVQAAALNLHGILELQSGDTAEAGALWKQALELNASDSAVRLNLALVSLRYGDADTAKQMLDKVDTDWFVTANMASVYRMLEKAGDAEESCKATLGKQDNHKPTLVNCGLFYAQLKDDKNEASRLIGLALKAPGGPASWNDEGKRYLELLTRKK